MIEKVYLLLKEAEKQASAKNHKLSIVCASKAIALSNDMMNKSLVKTASSAQEESVKKVVGKMMSTAATILSKNGLSSDDIKEIFASAMTKEAQPYGTSGVREDPLKPGSENSAAGLIRVLLQKAQEGDQRAIKSLYGAATQYFGASFEGQNSLGGKVDMLGGAPASPFQGNPLAPKSLGGGTDDEASWRNLNHRKGDEGLLSR